MAVDPDLVDRMEAALIARGAAPVRHKMFGGIALMVDGHMSYGTARGEMQVRVGRDAWPEALARPGASEMTFTGRSMKGWVTVEGPSDLDDEALGVWADMTLAFNRTLPAK